MATNNFKPFAIGSGSNVTSQADYEALAALITGFQSGKASSAQINKAIRQSSVMAYVLAQFISDIAGVDVLDNGVPASILSNLKSSMTALTPGRLLNVQKFTASGTYTPSPGAKSIVVDVVGAGGGGGSAAATNSAQVSIASGGSAGAHARSRIMLSDISTPVSITVGVAGSGGSASANAGGGGGSASYFGSAIVAPGGPGGAASSAVSSSSPAANIPTGRSNLSTGGSISNSAGQGGGAGFFCGSALSGAGGSTLFGSGGNAAQNAVGNIGTGYGTGGSGASSLSSVAARSGGDGASGVVIIWEYA